MRQELTWARLGGGRGKGPPFSHWLWSSISQYFLLTLVNQCNLARARVFKHLYCGAFFQGLWNVRWKRRLENVEASIARHKAHRESHQKTLPHWGEQVPPGTDPLPHLPTSLSPGPWPAPHHSKVHILLHEEVIGHCSSKTTSSFCVVDLFWKFLLISFQQQRLHFADLLCFNPERLTLKVAPSTVLLETLQLSWAWHSYLPPSQSVL